MKVLFWFSGIICIGLGIRIGAILISDLGRLTMYGYGYLTGLVVLFLLCASLAIFSGIRAYRR